MLAYVGHKGERLHCFGGPKDEKPEDVAGRCYHNGLLYPKEKPFTLYEVKPYDCTPEEKHPEFL